MVYVALMANDRMFLVNTTTNSFITLAKWDIGCGWCPVQTDPQDVDAFFSADYDRKMDATENNGDGQGSGPWVVMLESDPAFCYSKFTKER